MEKVERSGRSSDEESAFNEWQARRWRTQRAQMKRHFLQNSSTFIPFDFNSNRNPRFTPLIKRTHCAFDECSALLLSNWSWSQKSQVCRSKRQRLSALSSSVGHHCAFGAKNMNSLRSLEESSTHTLVKLFVHSQKKSERLVMFRVHVNTFVPHFSVPKLDQTAWRHVCSPPHSLFCSFLW